MTKLIAIALLLLPIVGCATVPAETDTPLECNSTVIDTDNGPRLLVNCNRAVEKEPESCKVVATATYECNIFHASAEDCATFPGICEVK